MAIIQISKIQVRSGNLVDLPQLDEAEFGWASDTKRLFIGKTTPNENIEILTSYSNIDFSQLTGSYGNLNISSPVTGQVLVYDESSNAWLNGGGNALDPGEPSYWASSPIHLGNVSTLKIGGGAIGYILETDGTGNLSWTPKGTISANISNATKASPVVITTSADNFFTDGDIVTITNVSGMTQLNGNSYFANVLTSNTFSLYSDSALTVPVNGTGYGTYTGNGRAITSVGGSGGGGGGAAGTTFSVQYNYAGVPAGDASFTWNNTSSTLTVTGTSNVTGNLNVSSNVTASRLISNVATGTSPLVVSSTTRVSNLNVAYSNVTDFVNITTATTGTHYLMLANALTGNVAEFANANLSFSAATGLLTTTALSVTGNANVGNLGTTGVFATTLSASGNANTGNLGTTGVFATTLSASGNANTGNLGTTGVFATTLSASGNIIGSNLISRSNIGAEFNIVGSTQTTADTAGGLINIIAGTGNGNAVGGNLNLLAGDVDSTATGVTRGGNVNIVAGVGYGTGTGGTISLRAGNSGNANSGGPASITLNSGTVLGPSAGRGGSLFIQCGASVGTDVDGTTVQILAGYGTGNGSPGRISFITSTAGTSGNSLQLPSIRAQIDSDGVNVLSTTSSTSTTTGALRVAGGAGVSGNLWVNGTINGNVTGNVTGNLSGTSVQSNIITTGANTTAGSITGDWTLTAGSRLQATYADLAEYYEADQPYEPATVLEFGGEKEVTLAQDGTTRVAGVVSTDPAYVMNAGCPGHAVPIALQGRVPVKVRGHIKKGDLMVSGGNGYARPWNNATPGMVIGKAIQNFEGVEGIIEIAVGRL
jgi:hypothetical protein